MLLSDTENIGERVILHVTSVTENSRGEGGISFTSLGNTIKEE